MHYRPHGNQSLGAPQDKDDWCFALTVTTCFLNHRLPYIRVFALMLLMTFSSNTEWCLKLKIDWNPGTWVLIWECSVRAIQWIPACQGFEGFQRSLHACALDESCLSTIRVSSHKLFFKPSISLDQGLSQDLETAGCPKLAIVKFSGILFIKVQLLSK